MGRHNADAALLTSFPPAITLGVNEERRCWGSVMQMGRSSVIVFGTADPASQAKTVQLGKFSFEPDPEAIRALCWDGVEVIRAIAWPMRDSNWGSLAQITDAAALDQGCDTVRFNVRFSVANGALRCELAMVADASGSLTAEMKMTAVEEFATNRAGFTVLHPIKGVVGQPLAVMHTDGTVESSRFPAAISPGQPAVDIAGLRYRVDGVDLDMAFQGDVFEMEDQRNWSDASYKTYCRPLVYPFTYRIGAGETVRQAITVKVSGTSATASASACGARLQLHPSDRKFPRIGLAIEQGWLCSRDRYSLMRECGVRHMQLRTGSAHDPGFLSEASALVRELGLELDAEIIIPQDAEAAGSLAAARDALAAAGLKPARVIALPEGYLDSHQPTGPWPEGPGPSAAAIAARTAFPDAQIGSGVLTNFTEFNRCRPAAELCDYVTHGSTPLVHAGDDRSVIQTIETLPQIFASAADIAAGKPYRLGLVSIGMRSNPYGAAVVDNPAQLRQTMAMYDPRQRGLFAAAWAVAVLGATEGQPVAALSLAAPGGPFGIISEPQPVPRPFFDETADALIYPLFHVVKAAAVLSGGSRFRLSGLPANVHGFAAKAGGRIDVVIANLGSSAARFRLPEGVTLTGILDETTFGRAVRTGAWRGRAKDNPTCDLAPFAVAFASLGIERR